MIEDIKTLYKDMLTRYNSNVSYPTGMPLLCSQLDKGLNVIAGRPSMGATTMAVSIATELALAGKRVLILAFPSHRAEEKLYRQFGYHFKLPYENNTNISKESWEKNFNNMANVKLWYEKLGYAFDFAYLRVKLWEYVREYAIQYIFIDCLQEIAIDKVIGNVNLVCSELRTLSYELDVPIIATSQLDRGPEIRKGMKGKEPQLFDFRGGDVEQYARLVYFLFRPEYYYLPEDKEKDSTMLKVIIAKNDNGHLGEEKMKFDMEHLRFYSQQSYANYLNMPHNANGQTVENELPF